MLDALYSTEFLATTNLGTTERLLNASFATTTYAKYAAMWHRFIDFILDVDLDFSEVAISKYVAFLFEANLKYNSIQVYLAAIAAGLQVRSLPDTTKSPLVARMISGTKN